MTDWQIIQGDCLEVMLGMPAGSVDLIVTDPPYPREYEHLYGQMAEQAKRVLRRGGSLVTLCGHYQLPRVLADMGQHLKYRWIVKYDQPGASARMAMGIRVTWKPMLWFVNEAFTPQRNVADCAVSGKRSKDTGHPWQQDTDYALWAIENLTDPGDLVVDPFMGTGSSGVAAVNLGRRFIGVDIEPRWCEVARQRLSTVQLGMGV